MSMSLRVIVPPHPLISHWLTILRNPTTPEILYATGLEQLGTWLTYEALRDWIPSKKEQITTSTGTTECSIIDPNIPILAIPYLPAGLELYRGARNLIPNSIFPTPISEEIVLGGYWIRLIPNNQPRERSALTTGQINNSWIPGNAWF